VKSSGHNIMKLRGSSWVQLAQFLGPGPGFGFLDRFRGFPGLAPELSGQRHTRVLCMVLVARCSNLQERNIEAASKDWLPMTAAQIVLKYGESAGHYT
jgi:hypothetical protein